MQSLHQEQKVGGLDEMLKQVQHDATNIGLPAILSHPELVSGSIFLTTDSTEGKLKVS